MNLNWFKVFVFFRLGIYLLFSVICFFHAFEVDFFLMLMLMVVIANNLKFITDYYRRSFDPPDKKKIRS